MGNCLVTKLKGVVDNDNLSKLGHLYVTCSSGELTRVNYRPRYMQLPVTVTLLGNGYFSDSTGEQNLGKSLTVNTAESSTAIYVNATSECKVDIPDNYIGNRLASYSVISGVKYRLGNYPDGISGHVDDSEDIDVTPGYKFDNSYGLYGAGVHGDFTNSLKLIPTTNFTFTALNRMFQVNVKGMTFDASIFRGTSGVVKYGCTSKYVNLYWNGDLTNDTIPGVLNVDFGEDLDAALIEMASRNTVMPSLATDMVIVVKGNKSASSDAAVATLKQKGFAVTINNVLQ